MLFRSTTYTASSSAGSTPTTSCAGATSPNYTISYTAGTVTIAQKAIAVTATSQTVTYGDSAATMKALPAVENAISPTAGTPLTLSAYDGIWTGAAGEATTRKWQYSTDAGTTWNDVSGQTGTTYTPPTADLRSEEHTSELQSH